MTTDEVFKVMVFNAAANLLFYIAGWYKGKKNR